MAVPPVLEDETAKLKKLRDEAVFEAIPRVLRSLLVEEEPGEGLETGSGEFPSMTRLAAPERSLYEASKPDQDR